MRAIYLDDIDDDIVPGTVVTVDGERGHHLVKVVRIRVSEKILILNGRGAGFLSQVEQVFKKGLKVIINSVEKFERKDNLHLAVCLPKKDAFEDVIRFAVEVGISKIIPIMSEYSSREIELGHPLNSRLAKIMENALIQSNNPYLPEISEIIEINKMESISSSYKNVAYFCSHDGFVTTDRYQFQQNDKVLIFIGPEGGLSQNDEEILQSLVNLLTINLPSNILRTQTAVCVASGHIIGRRKGG